MQLLCLTTLLLSIIRLVYSIEVTPESKCSPLCADDISDPSGIANILDSWTVPDMFVCEDDQLAGPNSTVQGRKWKECLNCELTSTAVDSNEIDLNWFLFNTKNSVNWCVFAYPDNINRTKAGIKCAETCQGRNYNAKTALVDRSRLINTTLQYQYCETENGAFTKVADDCVKCLEKVPNSKAMANYVKALNVACSQKPAKGKTLKLGFELFPDVSTQSPTLLTQSEAVIPITANPLYPAQSAVSIIFASAASQSSAVATAAAQAKAKSDRSRSLGLGVGIPAGGIFFILATLGLIFGRQQAKRNRLIAEEQARARWEADYHARHSEQQHDLSGYRRPPEELDTSYNNNAIPYEADNGRPRVELPSRSTSRTL